MTKIQILEAAIHILEQQASFLLQDLQEIQQALAEDSKSSAGDKYETSREMANQEIIKIQQQVQLSATTCALLRKAQLESSEQSGFGKLIETNQGYLILGIPFKRIALNTPGENQVMGISMDAPLAQKLNVAQAGECISLPNYSLKIIAITL